MRIAVLGDPHFAIEAESSARHSHNLLNAQGIPVSDGPWNSLLKLIDGSRLRADYLICAGDLGTHAEPKTITNGWAQLQQLGKSLEAAVLACATGNHDVLSRSNKDKLKDNIIRGLGESVGMEETLKNLQPEYPVSGVSPEMGRTLRTNYFGENIAVYRDKQVRIVVLNSCCEHNGDEHQQERGSAPKSALAALKAELKGDHDPERINLLVCHHPPMALGSSYEFIQGGASLIELLEDSAQWLLIHGHIHKGRIRYGEGGSSSSPILFSAASLGAKAVASGQGVRNQFYILDLFSVAGELRGAVEAWDWRPADGWEPARRVFGGIHHRSGFGIRPSLESLAKEIVSLFPEYARWDQVEIKFPQMKYFAPETLRLLKDRLARLNRIVDTDDDGNWAALAKSGGDP